MTADESRPEWLEPLVDQRDPRLLDVERWFKRVGVPHFIEGYSSADRVHGRTVPVVGILVMTQLVLGSSWSGRSSISAWGKVLGLLIGIQVLWTIASQTFRRRHPRADLTAGDARASHSAPVAEIHGFHVAQRRLDYVFLVGSALAAALTHDQNLIGILGWFALNTTLVIAMYVFTGYGGLAIIRWAIGHTVREIGSLGRLMTVAVPRIALIVAILLLTTETWQTAGSVDGPRYVWGLSLLYAAALAFSSRAARSDIERLGPGSAGHSYDAISQRCNLTPAAALCELATPDRVQVAAAIPFNRRQRVNVAAVFAIALIVQVTLVSIAVGIFVVALGALVVPLATIDAWLAPVGGHVLWRVTTNITVTEELLRVVGFVMAFSALTFTVSAVTDESFRRDFYENLLRPLSTVAAARAMYLAVRGGTSPG